MRALPLTKNNNDKESKAFDLDEAWDQGHSILILNNDIKSFDNCLTTSCYSIWSILLRHYEKRQTLEKLLPVISGKIHLTGNTAEIDILLDSWASQSIVTMK
jgi:hypothetical protein